MGSEIRTSAPAHATGAVVFVGLDEIAADETFRLRPEGDTALLAASMGRLGQLEPVELRPWPGGGAGGEGQPRYQLVAGYRRLAGLKLLLRDRVLARVHTGLSDEDAWALALVNALAVEPLAEAELLALKDRLQASGVAPWALDLLEEARVRAPLPQEVRERFYEFLEGPLPPVEGGGDEEEATAASPSTAASTWTATATATPTPTPTAAPAGQVAQADQVEEVSADDFARDLAVRMSDLNQDLATAYASWADLPPAGRKLIIAQARYVAELLPYLEDAER